MDWLAEIGSILGVVEDVAAPLEHLLGGIGQFVATEARKLFGNDAAAKVVAWTDGADQIVKNVVGTTEDSLKFVETMWPTLVDLEKAFPGLVKSLVARWNLMRDIPNTSHAIAAKLVESAHANMRVGEK